MDTRVNRRTVAKGAGVLAGAAATRALLPANAEAAQSTATAESTATTEPDLSLYERLGGVFAIAAVVDRFSDAIITTPELNENPALREWNETEAPTRLPGLKFMR